MRLRCAALAIGEQAQGMGLRNRLGTGIDRHATPKPRSPASSEARLVGKILHFSLFSEDFAISRRM